MSAYETVRLEIEGNVATITLARPDRMNALCPKMFDELAHALDAVEASAARALVLTGEGRAFCSGADLIGAPGESPLPEDIGEAVDAWYNPLAKRLADYPLPIVTALNGPAVGAGVSIALAGDIVLCARSAYLLLAFVNIGLVPDTGASWYVAKAAGRLKALEMALLGERVPAEEALAAGLVTRVVDDAALAGEASATAAKLAAKPTKAITLIRAQMKAALGGTLEETLAIERDHMSRAGFTRDFREGVRAFGEKRPPVFEGR